MAPPPPPPIEVQLDEVVQALKSGKIEAAAEVAMRAVGRDRGHAGAAEWNAVVADLLWRDELAILEQRRAVAIARAAGADAAELARLQGRLGELMFTAGRWGEATVWLQAGASGDEQVRRDAFAAVTRHLPYSRQQSGPFLTEQRLLPGAGPEFACGVAGRQRSLAIDTGTSMTTLSRAFAAELGARAQRPAGEAVDAAGRGFVVEVAVLDDFTVGDIGMGALPALVVDDALLRMRDLHGGPERVPRGVLGLDLLAAFRLTIDPERESVVLERPTGLRPSDSVQCVRAEGRCLLPVEVEGARRWFVLDTGASHSSLTLEGLDVLPGGDARAVPAFRRVHAVGGAMVAVREVRDLVLRTSEARFQGVVLPVVARRSSGFFPVHGVLGMDLLGRCRVTFDRGRARITAVR